MEVAKPTLIEEPGAITSPKLDGSGLKIALISTRHCDQVINSLLSACRGELLLKGVQRANLCEIQVSVPFELPYAVNCALAGCKVDAVVVIGCLIQGTSLSYEFVSEAVTRSLMKISLVHQVPVINGVITCTTEAQAKCCAGLVTDQPGCSGKKECNHGIEWAQTAIEMAHLTQETQKKIVQSCQCNCHGGSSQCTKCSCESEEASSSSHKEQQMEQKQST
jgi:6,7-dimethyl-8-ribityllumazine synthase